MGLFGSNFNDYDYGVSYKGLDKIKDDIKMHLVTEATEKLEDYYTVTNSISSAWHGEDSENFIDNFTTSIKEVKEALNDYNAQIEKKLNEIYDMWKKFQQSNVQK